MSGPTNSKFRSTTVIAVVIANMVGTGVFTSLGFQLLEIHSGFALLALWAVGGIAADGKGEGLAFVFVAKTVTIPRASWGHS